LPVFTGDRLGKTGLLFPRKKFDFRPDKNNAHYAPNGYIDARAGDASHINLFLALTKPVADPVHLCPGSLATF
jgi:hypothetical protein